MNPARALQTVADLGARALSSTPVGDLLDAGMRLAREVTQSDHAVFFERSPGGDALLMRAGIGWRPGVIGRVSLSTGQGSFGRYILQQPTRIVDALPSHPEFGLPAVLREHNVESMACVRLDGIGHPLGVVAVFNVNDGLPSTEHLTFLQALGNILATAILRQVTEEGLLQSQIRLQSVQKMEAIGRLAGGIAHDFNNLVQAIGGYTEILLRQLREDDPLRRNAEEIKKAGDRAAALTRQLLAFSRQQVLQPSLLDVNHVVNHVEQLLTRLIGEDIELRTYLSDDLWPVKADAAQLEQVLMNLAVNARDAMRDGGLLTIETANVELTRSVDGEPFAVVAGPVRAAGGDRHRHGHERRDQGARVRAVLHDQAAGAGHRPRAVDGVRHRQAERRLHLGGQRTRCGHAHSHLPAAGRRDAPATGIAGRGRGAALARRRPRRRRGSARRRRRSRCCWSRTRTASAS